jgi:hypothetical protein
MELLSESLIINPGSASCAQKSPGFEQILLFDYYFYAALLQVLRFFTLQKKHGDKSIPPVYVYVIYILFNQNIRNNFGEGVRSIGEIEKGDRVPHYGG